MDLIASLSPDGVSALAAGAIIIIAFFTSALTAAFGLGGGLALLAAMSVLFPPAAVVPVHGVAQLGSNLSRFFFLSRHALWPIVAWFSAGAVIGSLLGASVAVSLPEAVLRFGVGVFILVTLWGPKPPSLSAGGGAFFAGGAVSSFLTMFFGATGPIVATILSVARLDRMQTVSTHAACLVVQHSLKTVAFGAIGFAFAPWAPLILAIILAGFAGSYAGTRLLKRLPEKAFKRGFRFLLSAIAVYLIGASIFSK